MCGKGPPAAALTSLTRYTLRAAAVYNSDPLAVLSNLNTVLLQQQNREDPRFCTVLFGLLVPDTDGFALTVASGGHPPALVIRADGGVQPLNTPGGQLVGILPHAHFATTVSRLNPGDAFLLYTDGLTEARNPDGSILGDDHLLHLAADLTRADADAIITTLAALLSDLGDGLTDAPPSSPSPSPTITGTPPPPV